MPRIFALSRFAAACRQNVRARVVKAARVFFYRSHAVEAR